MATAFNCAACRPALCSKIVQAEPTRGLRARRRPLCHGLEGIPQHFQVLRGLYRWHRAHADLRTAETLSQALLAVAQGRHDAVLVLESHLAIGSLASYRGHPVTAHAHTGTV
jgi:hypothetical protein